MTDILIVEDNEELGALIRDFLVRDGFTVTWKTTGEDGLSALKEDKYRLMLLDVMLPGFDGYETLRILRKDLGLPVIMMSAKNDDQSKILGLDVGADDDASEERKELSYKDIKVDLDDMTVRKGDKVIPVNGKELDILIYFLKNPEKVIHKEVLFNAVWGTDCISEMSTLTVYIRWLREKLEDDPKNPEYIHTVWRVGYKFGGESSK